MIPTRYPLACGGELSVCHTDKFKAGMLSVSLVLPIDPQKAWLTSLLLSVLRRGTERYPTLAAINRRLDYLYGTELSIRNFYRGDCRIVGFSADLLGSGVLPDGEDPVAGALDVMCQILFHPILDEHGLLDARYVESEKLQHCDNVRALKNSPRSYASDRCRALLYQDEPCGASIYGAIEDVMALTPKELTEHWRELLRDVRFSCFYVGAEPAERIKEALETAFEREGVRRTGEAAPLWLPQVVRSAKEVRAGEESLAVGQSQLVLAWRTGTTMLDPDYCACAVMNEMLGNSPISKLFVQVRERLSLCYFCSSHYNAYKGTLTVHCGLDAKDAALARQEILAQLQAIANGNFTRKELDAAKRSICNAYEQIKDMPAALESFYFGRSLLGVRDTADEMRRRFAAVGRKEVIAAAGRLTLQVDYFLRGTLASEEDDDEEN